MQHNTGLTRVCVRRIACDPQRGSLRSTEILARPTPSYWVWGTMPARISNVLLTQLPRQAYILASSALAVAIHT